MVFALAFFDFSNQRIQINAVRLFSFDGSSSNSNQRVIGIHDRQLPFIPIQRLYIDACAGRPVPWFPLRSKPWAATLQR